MKTRIVLLLTFLFITGGMELKAQEAYAVVSTDGATLTFYYDNLRSSREGFKYSLNYGTSEPIWSGYRYPIENVIFDVSFTNARPTSTYNWFYLPELKSITNLDYLNTSNVTIMRRMFNSCGYNSGGIPVIDVSHFDTSNVKDMSEMFSGCQSQQILLGNINTSNVTTMEKMFQACNFTEIDVSHFDTHNVTNMYEMFFACERLKSIDVSIFDFSNVVNMRGMFRECYNLKVIIWNNPNTSKVQNMHGLFDSCESLKNIDLDSINTSNVLDMSYMFYGCKGLTTIDLSHFQTSKVEYMDYMFSKCTSLTQIDVSNFVTNNVKKLGGMFSDCSSLTCLDLSNFNTSNVIDMGAMFWGCCSLKDLNVCSFNTSKVKLFYNMFSNCSSLKNIDVSNFNTSSVTDMWNMFSGCSSLTNLDLSNFDTTNASNTNNMIKDCHRLRSLSISSSMNNLNNNVCTGIGSFSSPCTIYAPEEFDFGVDVSGSYFQWKGGCFTINGEESEPYALLSTDGLSLTFYYDNQKLSREGIAYPLNEGENVPEWNNGSLTQHIIAAVFDESFIDVRPITTYKWFYNMTNLTSIRGLQNLDTYNVTNMASMFESCWSLTNLDVSNFDMSNVSNTNHMLRDCNSLVLLTICPMMKNLNNNACANVGTTSSPCTIVAPGGFDFGVDTTGRYFYWKDGCFTLKEEAEPYALLSADGTTLTFYFDKQRYNRTETSYGLNVGNNYSEWNTIANGININKVVFNSSFANARPTTCYGWFKGLSSLISITGISYLNTSEVTNMSHMFLDCRNLTSLDLSYFDTSNVIDMSYMFGNTNLVSLDLSNFDTSKVKNMNRMFSGCRNLTSLDFSNFDTSEVKDMSGMFEYCNDLTYLNLSNFETSNVIDMNNMFYECISLTSLDLSNFDTSKVADMSSMFCDSYSLTYLNLSSFDTSNVTDMAGMFYDCSSLESLDLSNFETSNVTRMSVMFESCYALTSLNLNSFDTSNVTDMSAMFNSCWALKSLNLSSFDTSNVTEMDYMFYDCQSLEYLDVSNFVINSDVQDYLFGYLENLKELHISTYMNYLVDYAFEGVGTTASPCLLVTPEGFDFGEGVNPSGDSFEWKSGWFTLFDYPDVDEEDPFQKYLDELADQQEAREEYADPDEDLDPFQKYLDLLGNDIPLTVPKAMVPRTELTIANGGFSSDSWDGGDHVFDIPQGSALVLNDITMDFSSEANYPEGAQLSLFDVSGELTLGENTVVKGWLDTESGITNAPRKPSTSTATKNRLATGDQVSGAVVSLTPGSTLHLGGVRLDDVVLLLNDDETNVTATAALQGEVKVVMPENAMVEGFKLMSAEAGYAFTLADAVSVNIVNGGGEWGAEVTEDGNLSLFPMSILGDVNGDGKVNVTDVTIVVDYILNRMPVSLREAAANVVRDNSITVSDVTAIVNIILGEK